jgi:hypothetical protein
MVATLRELYAKSRTPSHDDQESAAQALGHIIEQAQALGRSHAAESVGQRSVAWGGNFVNALQSGWDIVTNFVGKISGWIADQISGGNDPSPEDIQAEIDTVADNVGDFEVHAAVESEVLRELTFAGTKMVRSIAQPGACQMCLDEAAKGAVPINDFTPPPYHGSCKCNAMGADEQ